MAIDIDEWTVLRGFANSASNALDLHAEEDDEEAIEDRQKVRDVLRCALSVDMRYIVFQPIADDMLAIKRKWEARPFNSDFADRNKH
jgi:hypothetical protein